MGQRSFFEISRRRYAFVMAAYSLAVAIIVGLLSLMTAVDKEGRWFCIGLSTLFSAIAAWRFFQARRLSATEPVYLLPDTAPVDAQEKYYRRWLWVSAIAFPAVTAMTAWDLSRLESGEVERVSLWGPLSWIYEFAGFGPTVATVPLLGLVCVSLFTYKLKKLGDRRPRE